MYDEEVRKLVYKNGAAYPDPTAGNAIREADKAPEHVKWFRRIVKEIASLVGLEVTGRIQVKDKQTGREYR